MTTEDPGPGTLDGSTISENHLKILLRHAEVRGDRRVARACRTALRRECPGGESAKIRAMSEAAQAWNEALRYWRDQRGKDPLDGPTEAQPIALMAVEFPCPLCHAPVVIENSGGAMRVPAHPVEAPVFPFGYDGAMFRVECPASMMPVTQACDGDHGAAECEDPACRVVELVDVKIPPPTPRTRTLPLPSPPKAPLPTGPEISAEERGRLESMRVWGDKEHTTQGHAYDPARRPGDTQPRLVGVEYKR